MNIMKILRFIVALPLAAPLLVLGFLLALAWKPAGFLGVIGLWLLGIEVDFG